MRIRTHGLIENLYIFTVVVFFFFYFLLLLIISFSTCLKDKCCTFFQTMAIEISLTCIVQRKKLQHVIFVFNGFPQSFSYSISNLIITVFKRIEQECSMKFNSLII
jgi:hypothetical protein